MARRHVQAPLEISNPIGGSDSTPNGRSVFCPRPGDFLLFPSYLPHTVPMRHARARPRISIAFNIHFVGKAMDRYANVNAVVMLRATGRSTCSSSFHIAPVGLCALQDVLRTKGVHVYAGMAQICPRLIEIDLGCTSTSRCPTASSTPVLFPCKAEAPGLMLFQWALPRSALALHQYLVVCIKACARDTQCQFGAVVVRTRQGSSAWRR
jgi:Putative 2OG-Fe(II) oxygenase